MSARCPSVCPLCGHGTYDPRLSALLDTVGLLMDVVADLKAGLEQVAFDQLPVLDQEEVKP